MIRAALFTLVCAAALSAASNGPFSETDVKNARAIIDAIYRVQYQKAIGLCRSLAAAAPDDPLPDVFLARTLWQQEISAKQALALSRFGAKDFFVEQQSIRYKLEPDREIEKEFDAITDKAIEKAKKRVLANPNDHRSWFLMGLAYQNLATFKASFQGGWRQAFLAGENTRRAHQRVLARYPDFADAMLSLGVYDHVAGSVNWFYKAWGLILGIHGDKKRGIQRIETAARESAFLGPDARTMLVLIYSREQRYRDALDTLNALHQQYPENCLIPIDQATLLIELNRPAEAIARYRALLTSLNTRNGARGCPGPNLVLRHLGMAQRWSGDLPASLETLTQAVAAPGAPQETLLARL
ncbi:MAG: hypothetical protein SFV54_25210, partial [Bryobacteraceae bacterium]|nr:hypothetical protein [Bryobacteraceae bacterium]